MTELTAGTYLSHAIISKDISNLIKSSAKHVSDAASLDSAENLIQASSGLVLDEIRWSGGGAGFEVRVETNVISGDVRVYDTIYLGIGSDPVSVASKRDTTIGRKPARGFEHSMTDSFFIWAQEGVDGLSYGLIPAQYSKSLLRDALILRSDQRLSDSKLEFEKLTALESSTRILRGKLVAAKDRQALNDLYNRIEDVRSERKRIEKDLRDNIEKQVRTNRLYERIALVNSIVGVALLIEDVSKVFSDIQDVEIRDPNDLTKFVEGKKVQVDGATIEMTRTLEVQRDKEKISDQDFADFLKEYKVPDAVIKMFRD